MLIRSDGVEPQIIIHEGACMMGTASSINLIGFSGLVRALGRSLRFEGFPSRSSNLKPYVKVSLSPFLTPPPPSHHHRHPASPTCKSFIIHTRSAPTDVGRLPSACSRYIPIIIMAPGHTRGPSFLAIGVTRLCRDVDAHRSLLSRSLLTELHESRSSNCD